MHRRFLLRLALTAPVLGIAGLWPVDPAADPARPSPGSPARKADPRPRLVVIDPGHGGHDPGAIGGRGTVEKDVTLDMAREVKRLLDAGGLVRAALTRNTDVFLPLGERVALARAAGADLFVSLHADSAPNREARGLSAYTLSEQASDAFASALARQENLADGAGGIDLKDTGPEIASILVDLAARHTRNAALHARGQLVAGAGRELRLLDNPMRSANFAVLKAPDIPSILVETGFLSNAEDEELLRNPNVRRQIARVLARELAAVLTHAPFA